MLGEKNIITDNYMKTNVTYRISLESYEILEKTNGDNLMNNDRRLIPFNSQYILVK